MRHHCSTFFDLADAFERLVLAQPAQFGKAFGLIFVVEEVAAENRGQPVLCDKGGKRQKDKPAFRAIAAPLPPALFG